MARPCITPGCTGLARTGPRCPDHEQQHQQRRNARRTHYRGDWPRISRQAIAAHRARHGDWCPGWQRPPHPATDLTVDHIDPQRLDLGVRVLCRSCNSSRGNRPD